MAADLHIHVMTDDMDESDLAAFKSSTLGSKYFNLNRRPNYFEGPECRRVMDSPSVYVGEVSWLKAAVFENEADFIPAPVQAVADAISEDLPIIGDELIEKVRVALLAQNKTGYNVASDNEIIAFLSEHKGQRAFTVSW